MNVGATVAAADTGEGGNGISVAIAVTEEKIHRKHTLLAYCICTHLSNFSTFWPSLICMIYCMEKVLYK